MEQKMRVIYTCFPGGRHKVLTLSYDDGRLEDRRLLEIMNEYGVRGTFNLNGGLAGEDRIPMTEYESLYKGQEVACHTYLHPTIARCPIEQVMKQILQDRSALEKVMRYPVQGMAYPNGSYNQEIINMLPAAGIKYARTITGTGGFDMPENWYRWNPTCHHNSNLLEHAKAFTDLYKKQYLYMMYVWGHSYEFTQMNNWKVMEDFCKTAGKRSDIWYATNVEITNYMEDAARLQFGVDGDFVYNPNAQAVWLEVDQKIVEIKAGESMEL